MSESEIKEYLSAMTDAELLSAFLIAENDLKTASEIEPNSEWHQSCFAGFLTFVNEIGRRGLVVGTKH